MEMQSHEGEAWILLETPKYWECHSGGIFAKESYSKGVDLAQEKEVCYNQQNWRFGNLKNILTSDIEMQSLEFALMGFSHYVPFPPVWNGNSYSVPLYVGCM